MFRYLVRRILWAMLLFLIITFVTFVIFFMAPQDPARAQCGGDQASRACLELATEKLGLDKPIYVQYGKFLQAARRRPFARLLVRHACEPERGDHGGRPRDRVARDRRRRPLDADRALGRDLLRVEAAIARRQGGDGLRPRRRVSPPGVDRVDLLVLLRRQVGHHADRQLRELLRRASGLGAARRALAVVLPHDLALDDVRDSLRRALRPHDQGERHGDAERGLRADRAREGRARTPGSVLARPPERDAAGRDDARHGHRCRPRRRDLHRERLPAAGARKRGGRARSAPRTSRRCRRSSSSRRSRSSSSTSSSTCCMPGSTPGSG